MNIIPLHVALAQANMTVGDLEENMRKIPAQCLYYSVGSASGEWSSTGASSEGGIPSAF